MIITARPSTHRFGDGDNDSDDDGGDGGGEDCDDYCGGVEDHQSSPKRTQDW